MMDYKLLLVKIITLLYKESLNKEGSDNSIDLVRTILGTINIGESVIGIDNSIQILTDLKETIIDMIKDVNSFEFDKEELKQRLKINCAYDEKLYESLEQAIDTEYDPGGNKRSIVSLRKNLSNYFKEKTISDVINKAAYEIKFNRSKIADINSFVADLISQIEPLQVNSNSKDTTIFGEVDLSDENSLTNVFKEIHNNNNDTGILKFGWQALNRMTDGGIRPGEFMFIAAGQHKYKTGFTLSLFKQLAQHNTPCMIDESKKPLLLRISFEDDLTNNLQFLYQVLKYEETNAPVNLKRENVSESEMAAYVRSNLRQNGFHIKMIRADPSQWTYRHICNKIIDMEANGYEIKCLMLDYLALVPTTGCSTGPTGTDMRDLFRRVRNFCASKKIAVITPHQLSSDAKQLLRNGVSEANFVKEIAEKGYFSGSKQLDQEIDLEVYIHLFKSKGKTYLSVQRGKHRIPTVINDIDKYFILEFPSNGMPIKEDINKPDSSMRKLPSDGEVIDSKIFTF